MKNTYLFLSLVCMMLFLLSCTDLDEQYLDSFADKELSLKQTIASTNVNSIMGKLRSGLCTQENMFALMSHPTDEFMGPTRGSDWDDNGVWRVLHSHKFDPTNARILQAYNTLSEALIASNIDILNAANSTIEAKAKTLRGFVLFMLADFWGKVSYRSETETDFLKIPKVFSRSEAITQAINDIESSMANLPDKDGEGYIYGEPTKDVARAILAKIYLNKFIYDGVATAPTADLDKVLEYTNAIMTSSGGYSLDANYFEGIFGKDNHESSETIFVVRNTPTNNGGFNSRWRMQTHYNHPGKISGWNGFTTIADFFNTFDQADPRFQTEVASVKSTYGINMGFLVGQQVGQDGINLKDRDGNLLVYTVDVDLNNSNETQGVRVVKYVPNNKDDDQPDNDYQLIRFADVLLMRAEALWRKGNDAGAIALINQLRTERGVPTLVTSISTDGIEILRERGFELYHEGWKRNDQIRFGKFGDAWTDKQAYTDGHTNLFPYPQTVLDAHPGLTQNPGY